MHILYSGGLLFKIGMDEIYAKKYLRFKGNAFIS